MKTRQRSPAKMGARRPGEVRAILQRAVADHQVGRLEEARRLYQEILKREPNQADALNLLGTIMMSDGNHQGALDHIQRAIAIVGSRADYFANLALVQEKLGDLEAAELSALKSVQLSPGDAGYHNTLGLIFEARQMFAEAEQSYRKAVQRQPGFGEALVNLGNVARLQGKEPEALAAYRKATEIRPPFAPAFLSLGHCLVLQDKPDKAKEALEMAAELRPDHPKTARLLGKVYRQLGRFDDALRTLQTADGLEPDVPETLIDLAMVQFQLGNGADTLETAARLIRLLPDRADGHALAGDALMLLGEDERAVASYRRAIELEPESARTHAYFANVLERLNRRAEAEAASRKALSISPRHPVANLVLARCEKLSGRADAAADRLESLLRLNETGTMATPLHILSELSELHELNGNFDRAFDLAVKAGREYEKNCRVQNIDKNDLWNRIDRLQQTFTPEWVAGWTPAPECAPVNLVFLVGFPRSGTTLLEQVLAAHPDVQTWDEHPFLAETVSEMTVPGRAYPDCLARLTPDEIQAARRSYLAKLSEIGIKPGGDGHFVDKFPMNLVELGAIYRLFPDAKVILALRHPCDCVLSGFFQAFQSNGSMASFDSIESGAILYSKAMSLLETYVGALPFDICRIRYEDLVDDLAGEVRGLLDCLGIGWHDNVLNYRRDLSGRFISTPSYHQVAQPIYGRSVGRWRHYGDRLGTVLPRLMPFIERYGYEA